MDFDAPDFFRYPRGASIFPDFHPARQTSTWRVTKIHVARHYSCYLYIQVKKLGNSLEGECGIAEQLHGAVEGDEGIGWR